MAEFDKVFAGSIPRFYDTLMVPLIFEGFAGLGLPFGTLDLLLADLALDLGHAVHRGTDAAFGTADSAGFRGTGGGAAGGPVGTD